MDEESKRRLWDHKYEDGLPSLTVPDPFFVSAYSEFVAQSFLVPGDALDIAGGLGRHALKLAGWGWRVSVVDVSQVALEGIGREARRLNLDVERIAADVAHFEMQPERYDLILLFYHCDRVLFQRVVSALRPNGLMVCKLAIRWSGKGGVEEAEGSPLGRQELPTLVPNLDVLHHSERQVRDRGVVEYVGRKADVTEYSR